MYVCYDEIQVDEPQSIDTDLFKGYVLEASPLPKIPVVSLEPMTKPQDIFHAYLDHQSREEEAINGTKSLIRSTSNDGRYPLVLFLDGIVSDYGTNFCQEYC